MELGYEFVGPRPNLQGQHLNPSFLTTISLWLRNFGNSELSPKLKLDHNEIYRIPSLQRSSANSDTNKSQSDSCVAAITDAPTSRRSLKPPTSVRR